MTFNVQLMKSFFNNDLNVFSDTSLDKNVTLVNILSMTASAPVSNIKVGQLL